MATSEGGRLLTNILDVHLQRSILGTILGLNFGMGVVTGILLEFQLGINWARFSNFAGEVVGKTLAMEGLFAFLLESTFLGLFLLGEKQLGLKGHLTAAITPLLGP